jgi:nucleotide sugar dehydrogenase
MDNLRNIVKAVIVGLGYVGLPLACAAAAAGIDVVGLDSNEETVNKLISGMSHIGDISDQDIIDALAKGFLPTTDQRCIAKADVIVICVPTPLDSKHHPDLSSVITAANSISTNLKPKSLIILESTTYPGTTEEILKPLFEKDNKKCGVDFFLAFSPERIDPGNKKFNIRNTPKIVGGVSSMCTQLATQFYEQFIEEVVTAKGTKEAETAKLLENTYRHINIALVNELAQLSHALDIDIWDVIRCASTKPFGFETFWPSAGVGGHCIPIDPNYLAFQVREKLDKPFKFIELAEEINRSMPKYVANRLREILNFKHKQVLILGVTYKPNVSDQRESPAIYLAEELIQLGAKISFFDPFVPEWKVNSINFVRPNTFEEALNSADLVVILQKHKFFIENSQLINNSQIPVLDTTGTFNGDFVSLL